MLVNCTCNLLQHDAIYHLGLFVDTGIISFMDNDASEIFNRQSVQLYLNMNSDAAVDFIISAILWVKRHDA